MDDLNNFLRLMLAPLSLEQTRRLERQIKELMKDTQYLKEVKEWETTVGDGIHAEE